MAGVRSNVVAGQVLAGHRVGDMARVTRLNRGQHRLPRSAAKTIQPGVTVKDALAHRELELTGQRVRW